MIPIRKSTKVMLIVEVNRELKTLVALIFFCLFIVEKWNKRDMVSISPKLPQKCEKYPKKQRFFGLFKFFC